MGNSVIQGARVPIARALVVHGSVDLRTLDEDERHIVDQFVDADLADRDGIDAIPTVGLYRELVRAGVLKVHYQVAVTNGRPGLLLHEIAIGAWNIPSGPLRNLQSAIALYLADGYLKLVKLSGRAALYEVVPR